MKPSDLPNPRDFRCHLPIQVRFADLDRLGHVNNATYQQYYDLGRLVYFDMLPASRPDWNGRVPVIAHLELDFLAPVTMRNQVAVCTRVVHVGERSFQFEQLLYRPGAEPRIYARCLSVMVGFDTQQATSAPLPDGWKEAIVAFERLPRNP